jgi:hypothetical protein
MSEKINNRIDEFEATLLDNFPIVNCPVRHKFSPGLYIREIFMEAGLTITSMQHKNIHPFFVMQGKVSVYSENDGVQEIEAPYTGITYPGTRRILHIHESTIWATVHPTNICPKDGSDEAIQEAVDLICKEIIEQRENKLLGGLLRNNSITPMVDNKVVNLVDEG